MSISRNRDSRPRIRPYLACGLILMSIVSGCGDKDKVHAQQQEEQYQANEKALTKIFNPAMAKAGQQAAKFALKDPNTLSWYENYGYKDKWSLSLSDSEQRHTIDLDLRAGADRSNITPGDVTSLTIKNYERFVDPLFLREYYHMSEIIIDPDGSPKAECGKNINASLRYEFLDKRGESSSASYVTTDRCDGDSLNVESLPETSYSTTAAQFIADTIPEELQKTFQAIK